MCKNQQAQIDCRRIICKYHEDGTCKNLSPALTLNSDQSFICWSYKELTDKEVELMTIICPTCKGKAIIKNPENLDETIKCPTCKGKYFTKSDTFPEGYDKIAETFAAEPSKEEGSMLTTT